MDKIEEISTEGMKDWNKEQLEELKNLSNEEKIKVLAQID